MRPIDRLSGMASSATTSGEAPSTEGIDAMKRSEKEKMLAGELYNAADCPELAADKTRISRWMDRYNATNTHTQAERQALLEEALGHVGLEVDIRPPFHCDYGYNISLGSGVFLNFGCVILDVVKVEIGEFTQIGPCVQILTADHPRDPELRARMLEFGRPVVIGANVWVGGGAIILPGVTVGDHALIGAGSVVTRDVPPHRAAVGNPARLRS
jgi:maltose O-acetyltransferase